MGRFISADAYTSTGQGVLGNNMFSYCGNNPIIYFDPSGNTCVMMCSGDVNLLVRDLSGFQSAIGGGGGGGLITEKPKTNGSLKDTVKCFWGGTSHGKILPWEFDLLSISNEGFTVIDASASVIDASVEWEDSSVILSRIFNVEASAGITKEDGVHAGIMASMLSAGTTISLWIIEVELTGYVGAIGGKAAINSNGLTFAFAPCGIGGGICVKWDMD